MLKDVFKRRKKKYTIVLEHTVEASTETSDRVQAHTVLVHRIISMLGYRPRQIVGGTYIGGVSTRVTVRAKSDDEAAALVAALNRCMVNHSVARFITDEPFDLFDERFDHLLNEMA